MSDYLIIIQDQSMRRRGSIGIFRCEDEETAIGVAEQKYPVLFDYIRDHDWGTKVEAA